MARIRANFATGAVDNAPLSNVATTLDSDELTLLPVVAAPDVAVLVLDPTRAAGAPEIVYVTAHTAGATQATILRGQEGTSARSHAAGTRWIHTVTALDLGATANTVANFTDMSGTGTVGLHFYDRDNTSTFRGSGFRQYVKNSAGAEVAVASMAFTPSDKTAGSEDGAVGFWTMRDGAISLGLDITRHRMHLRAPVESYESGKLITLYGDTGQYVGKISSNGNVFVGGTEAAENQAPLIRLTRGSMQIYIERTGADTFTGTGGAGSGPWNSYAILLKQDARNIGNGGFLNYHDSTDDQPIFRINRDAFLLQQYPGLYPASVLSWNTRTVNARNNGNSVEWWEGFHRNAANNNHDSLYYEIGRKVDGSWYGRMQFSHNEISINSANFKIADDKFMLSTKHRAHQVEITTQENTSSTSYTVLTTNTPQISISNPPSKRIAVAVSFEGYNSGGSQAYMTPRLYNTAVGAYINTASDTDAAVVGGVSTWSRGFRLTIFDTSSAAEGAGINIDTWFKSANGSVCYFQHRRVIAWACP